MTRRSEAAALVRKAAETWLDRPGVSAFLREVEGSDLRPAIEAAARDLDAEALSVLFVAHVESGGTVDGNLLRMLVPWLADLGLVLAAIGLCADEAAGPVLDVCESRLLAWEREAAVLLAVLELGPGRHRARCARRIRLLARERLGFEAAVIVALGAEASGDPHVKEVAQPWIEATPASIRRGMRHSLMKMLRERSPLRALPERYVDPVLGEQPIRNEVARVGRNDPCPCGSGNKYKRCCGAPGHVAVSTGATAPARPKRRFDPAPYLAMDYHEFADLRPATIARLDVRALSYGQLIAARRTFAEYGLWDHADRCQERIATHPQRDPEDVDGQLNDYLMDLFSAGEIERARGWIERAEDPESLRKEHRIALLIGRPEEGPLADLERVAREILAGSDDDVSEAELSYALLDALPALGILVGRGSIDPASQFDSWMIVREIERARDRLLLPPVDVAHELLEAVFSDRDAAPPVAREVDEEKLKEIRDEARRARRRVARLEEELRTRERELARERARLEKSARSRAEREKPAAPAPGDAEERARLREKIERLKALIDEGNEKRRELRRQLDEAVEQRGGGEATVQAESEPRDREPAADDEPTMHPLRALRFRDAAEKALFDAPAAVARKALLGAAALAGGGDEAWREAKPMRGIPGLWSCRIGIHHRLLFRVGEDGKILDVVDLVTRGELDTRLRRLRSV